MANLRYQSDNDSSGIEGNIPDVPGTESDCSGSTEGPEEYGSQSEDSIMDDDSFLTNQQLQKLHKLPKSLNVVKSIFSSIKQCSSLHIFREEVLLRIVIEMLKGKTLDSS